MAIALIARQIHKINCHIEALYQVGAFDSGYEELGQLHFQQVARQTCQFILLKVKLHCQSGWVLRSHSENGRQTEERHAFKDSELFEFEGFFIAISRLHRLDEDEFEVCILSPIHEFERKLEFLSFLPESSHQRNH